jgi:enterochelin esterase family protein
MRRYLPWASALVFLAGASAQAPRREPALSDTLKSPEVSADHHVTFRILAPKASEVTLTGDWLGAAPPPKLNKDERGVWSVTLGPFEPSIYI